MCVVKIMFAMHNNNEKHHLVPLWCLFVILVPSTSVQTYLLKGANIRVIFLRKSIKFVQLIESAYLK